MSVSERGWLGAKEEMTRSARRGEEERRGDSKEGRAERCEAGPPGPEPGLVARDRLLAPEVAG